MDILRAFLVATAFAYLACLVYTLMGKPALANFPKNVQGLFYALAFVVFLVTALYSIPREIYWILGAVYGFAALGSFIGYPQVWMAYWTTNPKGGSAAGQIGMSLWDLAIAVVFLMMS